MRKIVLFTLIVLAVLVSTTSAILTNERADQIVLDRAGVKFMENENVTRGDIYVALKSVGCDIEMPDLAHILDPVSLFALCDLPKVWRNGTVALKDLPIGKLAAPCFVPGGSIWAQFDQSGNLADVEAVTKIDGHLAVVQLDKESGEIIATTEPVIVPVQKK